MRAFTPFNGGECGAPIFEEFLQDRRYKGDSGVTSGTCGVINKRAQLTLM